MTASQYGPGLLGSDVIQRASAEHLHGADRVCQRRKARCSTEASLLEKSVQNAPESLPVGVIDGAYLGSLTKTCTKCGETKPTSGFSPSAKGKGGLHSQCRVCRGAYRRAWGGANKDKVSEANRRSYCRNGLKQRAAQTDRYAADPSKRIEDERRRRHADPVKARAKERLKYLRHGERIRAYAKAYRETNPDKVRSYSAARRRGPAISPWATWDQIRAVHLEAQRLTKQTGVRHQVDHIYPVKGATVSGLNCPANLRSIPADVNARKRNKLPGFLAHELWDPNGPDVFHE